VPSTFEEIRTSAEPRRVAKLDQMREQSDEVHYGNTAFEIELTRGGGKRCATDRG
jgi:hypothetical protein